MSNDKREILSIIDTYVHAFETANADLMRNIFWIDAPRFTEVENHILETFGRDRFLWIMDWIKKHQKPGEKNEVLRHKSVYAFS